jgi:hypothetical protein
MKNSKAEQLIKIVGRMWLYARIRNLLFMPQWHSEFASLLHIGFNGTLGVALLFSSFAECDSLRGKIQPEYIQI